MQEVSLSCVIDACFCVCLLHMYEYIRMYKYMKCSHCCSSVFPYFSLFEWRCLLFKDIHHKIHFNLCAAGLTERAFNCSLKLFSLPVTSWAFLEIVKNIEVK